MGTSWKAWLVGDLPNIIGLQNDDALSSGKGTNQGWLNDEAGHGQPASTWHLLILVQPLESDLGLAPITNPSLELWGMVWSDFSIRLKFLKCATQQPQKSSKRQILRSNGGELNLLPSVWLLYLGDQHRWGFCRLSLYPLWWSIYSQGMSKGVSSFCSSFCHIVSWQYGTIDIIRILLDINRYHI